MYYVGQVLYYQLNIDYIIETYCVNKEEPELQCNGKCHLAKQLQVVSNQTSNTDSNAIVNVLAESFIPVYFQSNTIQQQFDQCFDCITVRNYNYSNLYAFHLEALLYKPPIV